MKKYEDKGKRPLEFNVGDKVLLKLTPQIWKKISTKTAQRALIPRYDGPFEVLKKVGAVAYRLQLPERLKVHPTFHVSYLKPYYEDTEALHLISKRNPPSNWKQFTKEVEKILDRSMSGQSKKNRRVEFLVQWKNCPEAEALWERDTTLWQFKGVRFFKWGRFVRPLLGHARHAKVHWMGIGPKGWGQHSVIVLLSLACSLVFQAWSHIKLFRGSSASCGWGLAIGASLAKAMVHAKARGEPLLVRAWPRLQSDVMLGQRHDAPKQRDAWVVMRCLRSDAMLGLWLGVCEAARLVRYNATLTKRCVALRTNADMRRGTLEANRCVGCEARCRLGIDAMVGELDDDW
uniref:Chromo domain-containing protein n=1 Tax=Chenopodium quinoa TaxID=63459 RepID=A0A803M2A2_CHEQI